MSDQYVNVDVVNLLFKTIIISVPFILIFFLAKVIARKDEHNFDVKYESEDIPILTSHPSKIFADRIDYAFPDAKTSLKWYNDPKEAAYRLERVLQQPLRFQREEKGMLMFTDPIWWYRASRNMYISKFEIIKGPMCLMDNHDELNISKIAVYRSNNIYHNFIYVETNSLKKTGLYDEAYWKRSLDSDGYCVEHYAVIGKRFISIDDFNSGSTIIDKKVVPVLGGIGRSRYVSKYNFIIATQRSVYNTRFFDRNSEKFLNGVLSGKISYNDFLSFMKVCCDTYDPLSKPLDPWDNFTD